MSKESIRVAVRVRPPTDPANHPSVWAIDEAVLPDGREAKVLKNKRNKKGFTFDHIFGPDAGQDEVYEDVVKPIVEKTLDGYNGTVFAYGVTGCLDPKTQVRMFDGTLKCAKDVVVGDVLTGDDYTPRSVLKLFSGTDDMYDVVQEAGDTYRVNKDHVLTLASSPDSYRLDISVRDYLHKSREWKKIHMGVKAPTKGASTQDNTNRTGIDLQYVGRGPYNGFMLDGNHRFLLMDGTITHNSGKTHTILGTKQNPGVIPRVVDHVFRRCVTEHAGSQTDERYMITVSYMEIYKEHIRDLLDPRAPDDQNLSVHMVGDSFGVPELTKRVVSSKKLLMNLVRKGSQHRMTSATLQNEVSSRSHAVLTLTVEKSEGHKISVSKLNIVDLAGSEKYQGTSASASRHEETKTINLSLHMLGRVISILSETKPGGTPAHIPYRDSRLTCVLKDALGGNAYTAMIACMHPDAQNESETMNTIGYAGRTKSISNTVTKNDIRRGAMSRLRSKVRELSEVIKTHEDFRASVIDIAARIKVGDRCEFGAAMSDLMSLLERVPTGDDDEARRTDAIANLEGQLHNIHFDTDADIPSERRSPEHDLFLTLSADMVDDILSESGVKVDSPTQFGIPPHASYQREFVASFCAQILEMTESMKGATQA